MRAVSAQGYLCMQRTLKPKIHRHSTDNCFDSGLTARLTLELETQQLGTNHRGESVLQSTRRSAPLVAALAFTNWVVFKNAPARLLFAVSIHPTARRSYPIPQARWPGGLGSGGFAHMGKGPRRVVPALVGRLNFKGFSCSRSDNSSSLKSLRMSLELAVGWRAPVGLLRTRPHSCSACCNVLGSLNAAASRQRLP